MQDVMLDLETLGTAPGSAILSVGAVALDPETGELGPQFHEKVKLASATAAGLTVDADTIVWWMGQSEEARRAVFFDPQTLPLYDVLQMFSNWLSRLDQDEVRVWGNGAAFDNVLLREAYAKLGLPAPWKHWNDRCYRTLKNLRPDVKLTRLGTHHDALDDAVSQARHACQIFAALRGGEAGVGMTDKSRPLEEAARTVVAGNQGYDLP